MEFPKDFHFRVWAMVAAWLVTLAVVDSRCTKADIKVALHRCNAELSYINNAVLSATSDNYSLVCSAFSAFILCVDPRIAACQNKMMKPYQHTRTTYSKAPYNCSIPPQVSIDSSEGKRQYQDPNPHKTSGYGFVSNSVKGQHYKDHIQHLMIVFSLAWLHW